MSTWMPERAAQDHHWFHPHDDLEYLLVQAQAGKELAYVAIQER
jgi:hypothetical protein